MPCAGLLTEKERQAVDNANTAMEALEIMTIAGADIAGEVAKAAKHTAESVLRDCGVVVDIIVIDRKGTIIAHAT